MSEPSKQRVRPFHCGTQAGDFQLGNCDNCHKGGEYTDANQMNWVWACDIQRALDEAYLGDGTVSAEIAQRMGCEPGENRYGWWCPELDPIEPVEEYAKRLAPPPTRPCSLYKRVWRSLKAAWDFWIKPWDREDHDCYEGMRSPLLAWRVAWGIHYDDREVVR